MVQEDDPSYVAERNRGGQRAGVKVDQVAKLCGSSAWIIGASRSLGACRWPFHTPTHAGLALVMKSDVGVEEVFGAC